MCRELGDVGDTHARVKQYKRAIKAGVDADLECHMSLWGLVDIIKVDDFI